MSTDTIDPFTAPFWAAAREGRLARPVCDDCGRSVFAPKLCCPACRSDKLTWQDSGGTGVIESCTVVHRPPDATWPAPYTLATVVLDEGWAMLSRLVDDEGRDLVAPESADDPDGLAFYGRRVTVRFVEDPRSPGRVLPCFVPDHPQGAAS